jgi:hypothetical protein
MSACADGSGAGRVPWRGAGFTSLKPHAVCGAFRSRCGGFSRSRHDAGETRPRGSANPEALVVLRGLRGVSGMTRLSGSRRRVCLGSGYAFASQCAQALDGSARIRCRVPGKTVSLESRRMHPRYSARACCRVSGAPASASLRCASWNSACPGGPESRGGASGPHAARQTQARRRDGPRMREVTDSRTSAGIGTGPCRTRTCSGRSGGRCRWRCSSTACSRRS